jgi:NADP-dependent 3-hydroxy acid dehydrogenase YdfG
MIALITGATSGFGKAIAEKFAANKYDVIITGRRNDLLQQVAENIRKKYDVNVLALNFDVRDKEAVTDHIGSLLNNWQSIDVLVNNAGLALGKDYFDEANMDDWETMIDTNVKGLLYVSRAVIPYMANRKKGPHHQHRAPLQQKKSTKKEMFIVQQKMQWKRFPME